MTAPFGGHGLPGHGREGGLEAALDDTTVTTRVAAHIGRPDPRSLRDALNR